MSACPIFLQPKREWRNVGDGLMHSDLVITTFTFLLMHDPWSTIATSKPVASIYRDLTDATVHCRRRRCCLFLSGCCCYADARISKMCPMFACFFSAAVISSIQILTSVCKTRPSTNARIINPSAPVTTRYFSDSATFNERVAFLPACVNILQLLLVSAKVGGG